MKILITERQYSVIKEEISASEAYNDSGVIQTMLEGRKNVGLVQPTKEELKMLESKGIYAIHVKENPARVPLYIIYRRDYKKEAEELYTIMKKYGGYAAFYATQDDTRRIGQLLSYNENDVDEYINQRKEAMTGINPDLDNKKNGVPKKNKKRY